MRRNRLMQKYAIISVIVLLCGTYFIPAFGSPVIEKTNGSTTDGTTLYVGGDGPGNYSTIMEAVYAATDGDTILVYSGTYYEHVTIGKRLTVVGEDKETTIIDGNGTGAVVFITASEGIFSSFSVVNGDTGIHLDSGVSNATVANNIITDHTTYGIDMDGSCDNDLIDGNRISENGLYGIFISSFCEYNTISNNIISNNKNGSQLQAFAYGLISGNSFEDNTDYGLVLMLWCNFNEIRENNFIGNGKEAFFFTSVFNKWKWNYWNRAHIGPKPIFGMIFFFPWLNFDLRPALQPYSVESNPLAILDTSLGSMKIKLYEDKMPITTENFIRLAKDDFFDGLVFHRVIDDFVIQGGGHYPDGSEKESPFGTIDLETHPDVLHVDGAISMARTSDPDSATNQFFICDTAQKHLDGEYAAFGKVLSGFTVLRTIASVETTSKYTMQDWPVENIVIQQVTIVS